VDYALPFDPFSRPVHPLMVRPQIETIFAHRCEVLAKRFGASAQVAEVASG
jgi:hypothetical protein